MSDPIVVTRTLVKRPLTDLEPKVMWAIIAGGIALFALLIIKDQGVLLSPLIEQAAPYVVAILAGYMTPSAGQTITTTKSTASGVQRQTEAHTGPAITTVTGPTPVQATMKMPTAEPTFTEILDDSPKVQNGKETEIIPGITPPSAARFLSTLPSARNQTGPQSIDGH